MEPVVYTPVSAVANLRRSMLISAMLAVFGVAITSLTGHPLMGLFFALGLGLGATNNRMLQRAVVARASMSVSKKRFNGGVLFRLSGITIIVFAAAMIVRPDGIAVAIGVAAFHLLMLVGAAVPVFRSLRPMP